MAYRYFKEEEILIKLKNVANFFITNLAEEHVSHWDFRVERNEDAPRDISTTACAACGLLELAEFLPKCEGSELLETNLNQAVKSTIKGCKIKQSGYVLLDFGKEI